MPTIESLERHIGNVEAENRNLRAKVESMTTHLADVENEMSDLKAMMDLPRFAPNVGGVDRIMWLIDMLRGDDLDEFIERFRKEYGDELVPDTEEAKPLSREVLQAIRNVKPRHGEAYASRLFLNDTEEELLRAIVSVTWREIADSHITTERLQRMLDYGLIKDVGWNDDGEPILMIADEGIRNLARRNDE